MFSRTQLLVVFLSLVHVCAGTQCTLCAPGKFQSGDIFFSPCTLCPNNTFSAMPGAALCAACPPFSSSVMGSSRCTFEPCTGENYTTGCVCPLGTSGPDGGACVSCGVGTYKNVTGDVSCDNCSSTKTSVAGSASCFCKADYFTTDSGDCLPCMDGKISREDSATCFCPNGTAVVDGRCAQIYNKGLRLTGFFQANETNSSSSDVDALIREIKSSIALQYNISEDLVQVIFTTPSRNLLQQSGLKVDVIIMAQSQEALAMIVNKTSTDPPRLLEDVQQSIIQNTVKNGAVFYCGDHEVSLGTSTTCVCEPGYTRCGTCSKCIACAAGLAKPLGGDGECGACSGNTFSRRAAAQCSPCPLSGVTTDNHTSCSCNTAFVFSKDTCTATEAVYLNVTGVLQLPQGTFSDSELQRILLDGFSAHLNFSRQFITIIVSQNKEDVSNGTDANASTSGRRLLYDLPFDYYFAALWQIARDDKLTYAKVEKFTKDAKNESITITDANGYRIVLWGAKLLEGYFTADGKPVSKCPDGQNRVQDFFNKLLFCNERTPIVQPEQVPGLWWLWLLVGGVAAGLIGGVFVFRHPGHTASSYERGRETTAPASTRAMFPAKLQCPATVSFEYQMVPGHLI